MLDAAPFEETAQSLRNLHADRTDQYRQLVLVESGDFFYDRVVFLTLGPVDLIFEVLTADRFVGRNYPHVQFVDLVEFLRFRFRRTRHTRQLFVHAEVVLQRYGR